MSRLCIDIALKKARKGLEDAGGRMPKIHDALFLLRSLLRLKGGERLTGGEREEWISLERRKRFQADSRRGKRY